MESIKLQNFLFDDNLTQLRLLNYLQKSKKTYNFGVHRNHSFEIIEHMMSVYSCYSSIGISFKYSDYDDSLSFTNLDNENDLIILWLDFSNYKKGYRQIY